LCHVSLLRAEFAANVRGVIMRLSNGVVELRARGLKDRHSICQRDFIRFAEVVGHRPVIEPYRDFLFHGIDLP